jgi:2-keto-4-pentenoate hydratase/2-oxohepta-3-ene-1,7-dioic acid hydratase in catechol pathway
MRLALYEIGGQKHLYASTDKGWVELWTNDLLSVIRDQDGGYGRLEEAAKKGSAELAPPAGARALAPLRTPGKMIFVGGNYRDALEALPPEVQARFRTDQPIVFAKLPTSITDPGAPIELPPGPESHTDYEGELAAIIGKGGRHITKESALEHVFGYTIINDVSERKLQHELNQMMIGKGMDTFCPMGPVVVLRDEIADPSGLAISTLINGDVVQESNTRQLIFTTADIIFHVSKQITLEPGDIIATGTPGGVGFMRKPPLFLQAGDTVTVEVEKIGRLENPVVAAVKSR